MKTVIHCDKCGRKAFIRVIYTFQNARFVGFFCSSCWLALRGTEGVVIQYSDFV